MGIFFSKRDKKKPEEPKEITLPEDKCVYEDSTRLYGNIKVGKTKCNIKYPELNHQNVLLASEAYFKFNSGEHQFSYTNLTPLVEKIKVHQCLMRHAAWCTKDKNQVILNMVIIDYYTKILMFHTEGIDVCFSKNPMVQSQKPTYVVKKIQKKEKEPEDLLHLLPNPPVSEIFDFEDHQDSDDENNNNNNNGPKNGGQGLLVGE